MKTLLNKGMLKILRIFYDNKNEKMHLREIARESKMQVQGVSRHLKELEKNKILKSQKTGNLKQYSLIKDKPAYFIFSMLDIEKIDNLPLLRKNAINDFIKKLPEPPIFAIVFGSTAKQNYRQDSDIDILIITNNKINSKVAEKEAEYNNSIKISSFQMGFNEFKKELKLKEDKVIQSALNTGIPILNHLQYYEAINDE